MNYTEINTYDLYQQGDSATTEEHQKALYALLCEFDRICAALRIPYFLFAGTLIGAVRHHGFIPWDDDLDVLMLRKDYERFFQEAPKLLNSKGFYLQREFSEHWPLFFSKLRLNGTACLEKYHPKDPKTHEGVYMDIFPCDNAYGSNFGRKLQFLCSKVVIAKGLDKRGYDTDSKGKKLFMTLCRILPRAPFLHIVKGPKKTSGYVHSFLGAASKFSKNVYPSTYFEKTIRFPFEGGQFPVPEQYDALLKILYGDYMKLPSEEERKCKQHTVLVDLKKSYECYQGYRDEMKFDVPSSSIR